MQALSLRRGSNLNEFQEQEVIGKYRLSIQANAMAYCEPRQTLPNLEDYTEVEVAILNADKGGFVHPRELGMPTEVFEYFDCDSVGAWVPWDAVVKIRDHLVNLVDK